MKDLKIYEILESLDGKFIIDSSMGIEAVVYDPTKHEILVFNPDSLEFSKYVPSKPLEIFVIYTKDSIIFRAFPKDSREDEIFFTYEAFDYSNVYTALTADAEKYLPTSVVEKLKKLISSYKPFFYDRGMLSRTDKTTEFTEEVVRVLSDEGIFVQEVTL